MEQRERKAATIKVPSKGGERKDEEDVEMKSGEEKPEIKEDLVSCCCCARSVQPVHKMRSLINRRKRTSS